MDLHELLDTATADLPDAPDLLPRVQRIHRRHTMLTRGGMLAATAALAVGAGTLTIAAPWHRSGATTAAASTGGAGSAISTGGAGAVYTPGVERFPVGQREAAPRLTGTTVAEKVYTTSYTGHVTVINVWGSWCTPCRDEATAFAAASKEHAGDDVRFLGIDSFDNGGTAVEFGLRYGIDYPSLTDPKGALTLLLRSVIPPDAVPATVIVDTHGKVAVRAVGPMTKAQLDAEIAYASA